MSTRALSDCQNIPDVISLCEAHYNKFKYLFVRLNNPLSKSVLMRLKMNLENFAVRSSLQQIQVCVYEAQQPPLQECTHEAQNEPRKFHCVKLTATNSSVCL